MSSRSDASKQEKQARTCSTVTPEQTQSVLARYLIPDVIPIVVDIEKSVGNTIVDAVTKQEYLDCFSYIASNPLGHNHPKLNEPKFEQTLLRVAKTKPSNSDFHTPELAQFVQTFATLAMPTDFKHLFFIEGGALAVENALKAAFDWKSQRSGKGDKIVHFKEAFHGRSGYTLSLTNTADPRKTDRFPKFDWPRITNPKLKFPITPEVENEIQLVERQAKVELDAAFAKYGDEIAAIIIEPIQGEGGDNHFRPEFHRLLRGYADTFDVMLIYDEVQTGLGLTGRTWAYEHYGVVPDIVCFGKKTQVCGIMAGPRLDQVARNVFVEPARINSTWGGNLTDMVRSQRYLQIIEEDGLVQNAATVGAYLLSQLKEICFQFPDLFSNPRGKGLMCAVDATSTEARNKLHLALMNEGLIVLKCGTKTIRFRPSLTFTNADVDLAKQRFILAIHKAFGAN